MNFQLIAISGEKKGDSFPIGPGGLLVGRSPDCDVIVNEPIVSRKHCRITQTESEVRIEALATHNPTLVNGVPKTQAALRAGDEIALGRYRFLLSSGSATLKPEHDDSRASRTWTWYKAMESRTEAPDRTPDDTPKTIHDLFFFYDTGQELSCTDTASEFLDAVQRRIEKRFGPGDCWLARVQSDDQLIFYSQSGEKRAVTNAVTDAMRRALEERRGILAPETALGPTEQPKARILAGPATMGENHVAVLAYRATDPQTALSEEDLTLFMLLARALAPLLYAVERIDQLRRDNERLRSHAGESLLLVGKSRGMARVRNTIAEAAHADLSVLITGDTGTGKELAAQLVHLQSPRGSGPLVVVNCAAIPRDLFESEFFGYEKGAFTGANSARSGLLAQADGGTLFLDEIGDLCLDNQARILRAVETGVFRRLGARQETCVKIRVIAATNRDIRAAVRNGAFREDLYHRLNGFEIHIPALRDRVSDIPLLAEHFFLMARGLAKHPLSGIAPEAMEHLRARAWPGNVRELRNCIFRAVSIATGHLVCANDIQEFYPGKTAENAAPSEFVSLEEAEKRYITEILANCEGNIARTADVLRIGRSTLYRKLTDYGI